MNLNKKIITLALASTFIGSASATTGTFNATAIGLAEPAIAEGTAINFGQIALTTGSICTMALDASLTGDCAATGNTAGVINVTSVFGGTRLAVTVATGVGTSATYTPVFSIASNITPTVTGAVADVAQSVVVDSGQTTFDINLYGAFEITADIAAAGSASAPYIVTVDFE